MIEVKERDPQQPGEGPLEINTANVQFWSKHARELERPHVMKAKRFLEYDCVRYVGDDNEYGERSSFVCLPLNTEESVMDDDTGREFSKKPYPKDYNSTIYTIIRTPEGFQCNCQGWTYRERQGRGGGLMVARAVMSWRCSSRSRLGGSDDELAED